MVALRGIVFTVIIHFPSTFYSDFEYLSLNGALLAIYRMGTLLCPLWPHATPIVALRVI